MGEYKKEYKMFCRLSEELKQKIEEAAKRNKWDLSKQVRATLEKVYGTEPYIPGFSPTPEVSRKKPGKWAKTLDETMTGGGNK